MRFRNIRITKNKGTLLCIIIAGMLLIIMGAGGRFIKMSGKSERFVKGEVLVKYKKNVSKTVIINSMRRMGATKIQDVGNTGLMHFRLKAGKGVEDAVASYKDDPDVEYAQPNYIYRMLETTPNDTDYESLWGLKNRGQTISNGFYPTNNPGVAGYDMDMELAWDEITDCTSVIVAVLDSGVQYNHVDLADNMWDDGEGHYGRDFVDDDDDPMDESGHGTHVVGTIGAIGNNSTGTTGLCWQVKIMAVRVLNKDGAGNTAFLYEGMGYAVENGANVINMSLGGADYDTAFSEAISNAKDNGVVVVVAAGNDGDDVDDAETVYPCKYEHDNIVCVAALDQGYELANFSNYGSESVDLGAPGANIMSDWIGDITIYEDDFNNAGILDWTEEDTDNGWSYKQGNYDLLTNPEGWPDADYPNNCNDIVYKSFNLTGSEADVKLYFYASYDIQENDFFRIYYSNAIGNPFPGGEELDELSGTTEGLAYLHGYSLPECVGEALCTVGFQLETDSDGTDKGVAILLFQIHTLNLSNNGYNLANGTSMAAPHVAGLAAMIMAYNPEYTYLDVVNSIKNGGEAVSALSSNTSTGKAVNAWGSLRYINPPTGVKAVKL